MVIMQANKQLPALTVKVDAGLCGVGAQGLVPNDHFLELLSDLQLLRHQSRRSQGQERVHTLI